MVSAMGDPDDASPYRQRRRLGFGRRAMRFIRHAGPIVGASNAAKHGRGGGSNHALTDRFFIEVGRRDPDDDAPPDEGLLASVPGWLLIVALLAIVGLAVWWGFR